MFGHTLSIPCPYLVPAISLGYVSGQSTMKANQKGFGSVELVAIILVLAIIGGLGYWVYSRQNSRDTASSSTTHTSSQTSETLTAESAATKLGDKLTSLANGHYKIKKGDGTTTSILINDDQTVEVTSGDSIQYRSDIIGDSTGVYTADLRALNTYANDTLGLNQVYTRTFNGVTGDTFISTVYKVGAYYLELVGGNGYFTLSWGK